MIVVSALHSTKDVVPSTMRVRVLMPPECPALKSLAELHKHVKANEVVWIYGIIDLLSLSEIHGLE
jgi:hypothetical protein